MSALSRSLAASLLLLTTLASPVAHAADEEEGIYVTVKVLDPEAKPIPTAVVRHVEEQERHRVNAETGEFPINVFYLPDGTEVLITKGMTLTFEISAPGFQNVKFQYLVKKRKNLVPVTLQPMALEMETDETAEDIPIQFGRDKPIE
jgi:hypothetical protein